MNLKKEEIDFGDENPKPIYPDLTIKLVGENGNAFNLLAIMRIGMRDHGILLEEISEFVREATSGDYNHLLRTCSKWVNVE